MNYVFGDLVECHSISKNELFIFLKEDEGNAIIFSNHYGDDDFTRTNGLFLVPMNDLKNPAEELERLESNRLESIFPTDVYVGDFIENSMSEKFKVIGIDPIFYPSKNVCSLVVQSQNKTISKIDWCEIVLEFHKDNFPCSQNLNIEEYKVKRNLERPVNFLDNKLAGKSKNPTFSFMLNSSDYLFNIKDSAENQEFIELYFRNIGRELKHTKTIKEVGFLLEVSRSDDTVNQFNIHFDSEHPKDCLLQNNEFGSCGVIEAYFPSKSIHFINNLHEYLRLELTSEKTFITIHSDYIKMNKNFQSDVNDTRSMHVFDIYINNVKDDQW